MSARTARSPVKSQSRAPGGSTPAVGLTSHVGLTPTTRMRAVRIERPGTPDGLQVRWVPRSEPGPGEVQVRVHASGLNPKDARVGSNPWRPWRRSDEPGGTGFGFDFAGQVAGLGPGVHDLAVGDLVWGFLDGAFGGAASDYLVAPRGWMSLRPPALDAPSAASLPLVGSSALQALRDVAGLRPGERVLIKGASGGVGSAAIQIAKAMGARVTAIASGEQAGRAAWLGADEIVREEALRGASLRWDVFLDCAGSSPVARYTPLLARGGRWVTVAPNAAVFALAPFSRLLARLGAPFFRYLIVRPRAADLEALSELVARDRVRPGPITPFALDDVSGAFRALGARSGPGRPVLVMSASPPATLAGRRGGVEHTHP